MPSPLVLLALACGEGAQDELPRAEMAEICGAAQPVQVLALEDEEILSPKQNQLERFADVWLYGVQTYARAVDDASFTWTTPENLPIAQTGARIESTDACGRNRRIVAEDVDKILPPLAADGPWLAGSLDTAALSWFDPRGNWPAIPLTVTQRPLWHVLHGDVVFVHRAQERDVAAITLVGDGVDTAVEVLATDVVATTVRYGYTEEFPPPAAIAVQRENGELLAVDLASGRSEVMLTDVRFFSTSSDLRWVVFQGGDPLDESDLRPHEAWLLDRETDEPILLEPFGDEEVGVDIVRDIVRLSFGTGFETTSTSFVHLPGRERVDLPGQWILFASTEDGYFALLKLDPVDAGITIFRVQDGGVVAVGDVQATSSEAAGALVVHDAAPYEGIAAQSERIPYDIVLLPLATLEPETIARRVWTNTAIAGDRYVDLVSTSDQPTFHGTLQTIDGPTGDVRIIDHDVYDHGAFSDQPEVPSPLPRGVDDVVYLVRERDTGRSGIWRARFE